MKRLVLGSAALALVALSAGAAGAQTYGGRYAYDGGYSQHRYDQGRQYYGGYDRGDRAYRDSDRDGVPDRREWNRDRDRDGRPDQYDRRDDRRYDRYSDRGRYGRHSFYGRNNYGRGW